MKVGGVEKDGVSINSKIRVYKHKVRTFSRDREEGVEKGSESGEES